MSGISSRPQTDRRLLPANERVAASHLAGQVEAETFHAGEPRRISVPLADLLRAPGGARDRQLLFGAAVQLFEIREGWAFVQAQADGYVGYVPEDALGPDHPVTHRVTARATHVYAEPSIKAQDRAMLSLGADLQVLSEKGAFAETAHGFVPTAHLGIADALSPDPVAIAETLLGTPYLWGGNSALGIDCSGLVQVACRFCGLDCPGDSDLQEAAFAGHRTEATPRRGDLLFWRGHVAWVADDDRILHANAHHMAVAYEGLQAAMSRIEAQGDGPVTSHVRLPMGGLL